MNNLQDKIRSDEYLGPMSNLRSAAKYYLRYQGLRGSAQQINQMIATTPAAVIIRMATERGYETF